MKQLMTFHITQLVHDRTNRYVQGNVCLIDEADGCLHVMSSKHRNVVEGARPTEGQKQVSPKKLEKSVADWLTESMERSGLSETEIKKRAEACGCTLQEAAEALTE